MMRAAMLRGSMVALAAAVVSTTACRDDAVLAAPVALKVSVPRGAVQATIAQESTQSDGSITYVVRLIANGVPVSSYQGMVSFAPGAFDLVSIAQARGGSTEAHVVNPNEVEQGRIRFAALTTTKFEAAESGYGVEALRFTVKPREAATHAGMKVSLDVVGTDKGVAVEKERVLASPVVEDASGHRER